MIKKILYSFLFFLIVTQVSAQEKVPLIKAGTKIEGKFLLYGQTVPMRFVIRTVTDSVLLDWNLRGYAFGSYLTSAAGFENGTKINFAQPAHQTVLKLAPDETFGLISKSAFRQLQKDKQFVYNNTHYVLKDDVTTFQAGDTQLSVLHVTGVEEACELWILNNADFPLICQIRNNPLGINFILTDIKL